MDLRWFALAQPRDPAAPRFFSIPFSRTISAETERVPRRGLLSKTGRFRHTKIARASHSFGRSPAAEGQILSSETALWKKKNGFSIARYASNAPLQRGLTARMDPSTPPARNMAQRPSASHRQKNCFFSGKSRWKVRFRQILVDGGRFGRPR